MTQRTSPAQRQMFYQAHQAGETYPAIAQRSGVSRECVRYWCRRQHAGGSCQTRYRRAPGGRLSRFSARVRYVVLRLRLEHPRWGPNRLRAKLKQRPSLQGQRLPSEASVGRYLHQWRRFRRPPKRIAASPTHRPDPPTYVHQRWQVDFKLGLPLTDGTRVNLFTVREPVGEACLGALLFPAGRVGQPARKVTLAEVRSVLRQCFARWGTLPDEIQTDGEPVLIDSAREAFPSSFRLWLVGLGITHRVIRSGKPTDQAEVERCHRTLNDYALVGNEACSPATLQQRLEVAVQELLFELPSRAAGCAGRPPAQAHPDLFQPRRPFGPEHELAHFDLARVDAYLATQTWERLAGATGQICIGGHHHYYTVGRAFSHQRIQVRFDPMDRSFVFTPRDDPARELNRRPARHLQVSDLTGLAMWPFGPGPQQLCLPLVFAKGVNC